MAIFSPPKESGKRSEVSEKSGKDIGQFPIQYAQILG